MNEHTTKIINERLIYSNYGYTTYKYSNDVYFKIAKLTYEKFENEEFQYIIEPYYDILNVLDDVDIPGIDLTKKNHKYYRVNITPVL